MSTHREVTLQRRPQSSIYEGGRNLRPTDVLLKDTSAGSEMSRGRHLMNWRASKAVCSVFKQNFESLSALRLYLVCVLELLLRCVETTLSHLWLQHPDCAEKWFIQIRFMSGMKVFLFNICIYSLALMLTNVSEWLPEVCLPGLLNLTQTKAHVSSFELVWYPHGICFIPNMRF